MIARYAVLAGRIRQDLGELAHVVDRIERAMEARHQDGPDRDLFLDSAALNLHDFYSGLERIFSHVATTVDQSTPSGSDWHRELLRQMTVEIPGLRPQVLSSDVAASVDEYLRFRHVVRHIYAFELDPERVERLANRLRPVYQEVVDALQAFATWVENLSAPGGSPSPGSTGASPS